MRCSDVTGLSVNPRRHVAGIPNVCVWTVGPERIWKWGHTSGAKHFLSWPSKSTISCFSERFRDSQHSLVSLLFSTESAPLCIHMYATTIGSNPRWSTEWDTSRWYLRSKCKLLLLQMWTERWVEMRKSYNSYATDIHSPYISSGVWYHLQQFSSTCQFTTLHCHNTVYLQWR